MQVPNPPIPGTPCFAQPALPTTVTTQSLHFIFFFFWSLASSNKKPICSHHWRVPKFGHGENKFSAYVGRPQLLQSKFFFCRDSELHQCRAFHPTPCTNSIEIAILITTIIGATACHWDHWPLILPSIFIRLVLVCCIVSYLWSFALAL